MPVVLLLLACVLSLSLSLSAVFVCQVIDPLCSPSALSLPALSLLQGVEDSSQAVGGVILYLHGGAYCLCTSATHRLLLANLVRDGDGAVMVQ